jgi:hypothetical protein
MARQKSRGTRWSEAITDAQAAADNLKSSIEALHGVQQEYQDWRDNLPENLEQSALGEKLDAMCDLEIESCTDTVSDVEEVLNEAEGMDLPLGFGRD